MPAPRRRPLSVLDVMILVAATAAGLAWTRSYALDYLLPFVAKKGALPQRYQLAWVLAAVPMLSAYSVGLFACQTLRPSPSGPRPGMVACGVVGLTLAVEVLLALLVRTMSLTVAGWRGTYGIGQPFPGSYVIAWGMPEAGLGIAAAWLFMAWDRSFRSEPTVEDRSGRVLGLTWVVVFLIKDGYFVSMMM